jgi:hypothetical protein
MLYFEGISVTVLIPCPLLPPLQDTTMTSQTPRIPSYTPAPPTNIECKPQISVRACNQLKLCKVDYAELPIIDLSKAKTADGRIQLAKEVVDAMTNQGFFYVINHGYTSEQVHRQNTF